MPGLLVGTSLTPAMIFIGTTFFNNFSDQKYLVDDFSKLVSEDEPFEASGDVLFPDGHTMKLSVVNIGHLSEEAKKEYLDSMQRQADEINSGKITYPAKVVEQQSADHQ